MNPAYGIIMWLVIGALAGWIGSKVMGTDARQGALANIVVGILGAFVGGFVTRLLFGDNPGNNGFIASLLVSLLGAIVVIWAYKKLSYSRRRV
jgi:uncharacterized membrane protein YeaQ/YmgE (transglycosylase-associated protein family)